MTTRPVYEVTLTVDREVLEEFDAWLHEHVREMLELPGFISAETFETDTDSPDTAGRTVHYVLESDDALQAYLSGPADEMRRAGALRFEGRLTAARRVLRPADGSGSPASAPELCLNCQAVLQGQYCARCGQRARGRLISIWELVRDAVGDLFELDSRLWRTIIPLMLRPGKLTHDYLIGRRARFMPPFRTYLVLSIVFFLVAFFDPQQQFGILFEPEAEPGTAEERRKTADKIRKEVLEDLAADGIYAPGANGGESVPLPETPPLPDGQKEDSDGLNVQVTPSGGLDVNCNFDDFDSDAPEWFTRRVTRERLQEICDRVVADSGRSFINQLLDNIPAALFILLPLMALVLKMLYPLSKRYYVEHLLFVLHFHAFFFLILTLEILFSRTTSWLGLPELVRNLSVFVVSVYVPVYLYKAMRRVYHQGRAITLLKYLFLFLTYVIGLFVLLLFAAFYTAFSI